MLCQAENYRPNVAATATLPLMTDLADYIRALRARERLSQNDLGELLGYSGQSARQKIYRVEKGDEGFTVEQLKRLIDRFRLDAMEVLALHSISDMPQITRSAVTNTMRDDVDDEDFIPVIVYLEATEGPPTKRVVGSKLRPPALQAVRDAYAMYAPDDTMEPRYRKGWLLWVNPAKPASEGRDAVVFTSDGAAVIRHIERRKGTLVGAALKRNTPIIAESKITGMHLIVGADQEG